MTYQERDLHGAVSEFIDEVGELPETVICTVQDAAAVEAVRCWYPGVQFVLDKSLPGRILVQRDPESVH